MASSKKPKTKTISATGLDITAQRMIYHAKVLVVGAGGIGCELLKNLVLTGFKDIEIIDLDTIDVSNLNRQFLFQKKHVKMSKAEVARESALKFNPNVNIVAHHDTIMSPNYNVNFFKEFEVVLNALDNRAARNHVNRLCLAAEVPLIESGTAGYDGQVELIYKGYTKCYECDPKPPQKSFPGCTIRNTPSEPIHCIVWAKHLFNQLFGEDDPDEDVSPDTADPEAAGEAGDKAMNVAATEEGNVKRMSTRLWAQSVDYNTEKLFKKLFHDDIKYLLSMSNLWKKRTPPKPLDWNNLPDSGVQQSSKAGIKDQRLWTLSECVKIFGESCQGLKKQLEALNADDHLVWDKDDTFAMDFVASCANIRAFIFNIPCHTKFDIKSMAGNIIPAIATTNAMIAGIVVLHAINAIKCQYEQCQAVYVRYKPNHRGLIVVPEKNLIPPNPLCLVCATKPKVVLFTNIHKMLVKDLEDIVLKNTLNMVAPDVCVNDGSGAIIISSEEGETDEYRNKCLSEARIQDSTILTADDFLQDFNLTIEVVHREDLKDLFTLSHEEELCPKKLEEPNGDNKENEEETKANEDDDDDDLMLVEDDDDTDMNSSEDKATDLSPTGRKRKIDNGVVPVKKRRLQDDSDVLDVDDL